MQEQVHGQVPRLSPDAHKVLSIRTGLCKGLSPSSLPRGFIATFPWRKLTGWDEALPSIPMRRAGFAFGGASHAGGQERLAHHGQKLQVGCSSFPVPSNYRKSPAALAWHSWGLLQLRREKHNRQYLFSPLLPFLSSPRRQTQREVPEESVAGGRMPPPLAAKCQPHVLSM